MYVHESIEAEVREDIMDGSISSIWVSLGFKHQRRILVGGYYRVWQHLGRRDGGASLTEAAQLSRWKAFLCQWERAFNEDKETKVLGDINLDWLTCLEPNPASNSKAYKIRRLVEQLATRILPYGVCQLVRGVTRSWPGQSDSCLDLMFSNKPEKMSEVNVTAQSSSDHRYIQATRYAKGIKSNPRYVVKRSYKDFNETEFIGEVQRLSWWDLYQTEDPDIAAQILSYKINNILDKFAPLKKVQTKSKFAPWLSSETKVMMTQRPSKSSEQ